MKDKSAQFKVLFVCMGNICRSPAAEGVFRHFLGKAGEDHKILVDSAGTLGYHAGSFPDQRMLDAASRRGYRLDSRARQVRHDDISEFDLIVPMDHENYDELRGIAEEVTDHIRLLGSFLPEGNVTGTIKPVPDPYYGGNKGFEQVLDMIEAACPAMLNYCLKNLK